MDLWCHHSLSHFFPYKTETSGWNLCNWVDRQTDSIRWFSFTYQWCANHSPILMEWWNAQ
jgi:hypothetical protein